MNEHERRLVPLSEPGRVAERAKGSRRVIDRDNDHSRPAADRRPGLFSERNFQGGLSRTDQW